MTFCSMSHIMLSVISLINSCESKEVSNGAAYASGANYKGGVEIDPTRNLCAGGEGSEISIRTLQPFESQSQDQQLYNSVTEECIMKKITSLILSLSILLVSASIAPRAMADDNVMTADYNKEDAYFTVAVDSTTTYIIVGYTVNTGLCKCTTETSYGTFSDSESTSGLEKTLHSQTTVTMLNGIIPASDSYSDSVSSKSMSNSLTISKTCDYWVIGGASSHDFWCNRKSGTSPSSFSLFYN